MSEGQGSVQQLCFKWTGKEFNLEVSPSNSIADVKRQLEGLTSVQPKRQKIIGLKTKAGKPADDDVLVSDLAPLKPGQKIMMMGTPETVVEAALKAEAEAQQTVTVQDDFDLSPEDAATLDVKDRPEVQERLARRLRSVEVKILNPPRPGKKCLVLDIDYTLFDLNSTAERPEELARPYLHEFLSACYAFYDIIIWSATSMKWVEVKMKELGVSTHPDYKLVCFLDHAAMVTVQTEKYGVFDCKPLAFVWAKFAGQYDEHNTIMLDDLRRNYVMNRQNGLVIRPFKRAHLTRDTDKELYYLTQYLIMIGELPRISHLNHKYWEQYLEGKRPLPPVPPSE